VPWQWSDAWGPKREKCEILQNRSLADPVDYFSAADLKRYFNVRTD